jgi:hypothetical protein
MLKVCDDQMSHSRPHGSISRGCPGIMSYFGLQLDKLSLILDFLRVSSGYLLIAQVEDSIVSCKGYILLLILKIFPRLPNSD